VISSQTVIVLGAGASHPYGFPLGEGLMTEVINGLSTDNSAFDIDVRNAANVNVQLTRAFAHLLRTRGLYSIDEIVQWHPEYRDVAKVAIARALIPRERDDYLDFNHAGFASPDRRWYRYFISHLLSSRREGRCPISTNKLSVVTFNYDRSLQRALYQFVLLNCAQTPADAAEQVECVQFFPVHGQLGGPDWLPTGEFSPRPYEPGTEDSQQLAKWARQIRIVDEEVRGTSTLDLAVNALTEAGVVCFLGFSYHPMNIQKLQISRLAGKKVIGSAFGISEGRRSAIVRSFKENNVDITLSPKDEDILRFLENTDVIYD
jgi:hypothetical protein